MYAREGITPYVSGDRMNATTAALNLLEAAATFEAWLVIHLRWKPVYMRTIANGALKSSRTCGRPQTAAVRTMGGHV